MKAGWQTKRLGDVATLQRGFDLPTQDRVSGKYQIVSSSGVIDTHRSCAVRGPGVATGRSGSIGNVFFIAEDFWPLNTVLYVKDFHGNDPRFVFHLLKKFDLKRFATGAGVPTLNRNFIHSELVCIPPLPEQQRIVRILDEAFAGISTAKANAEKNLLNACALYESHRDALFTQRKGWARKPLGDMATFRNGLNYTKSSKGEPVKIVGVRNFQNNYWAPLNDLDTITPDSSLSDSDTLQENDLVFVRSNGNPELIGRCMLIGAIGERTTHSGFTIRARLNTSEISPVYLCHFLKSNRARRIMIEGGNGVNIKSLNQGTLSDLVIPFPAGTEQARIVQQLEALQSEVQRLESIYQQKLTALEELKKSLLEQAFTGKL